LFIAIVVLLLDFFWILSDGFFDALNAMSPAPATATATDMTSASCSSISTIEVASDPAVPSSRKRKSAETTSTSSTSNTSNNHPSTIPDTPANPSLPVKSSKKPQIDSRCTVSHPCHVFEDPSNGDIYYATLNQTNIGANANKFYVMQLLEADTGDKWYLWTRWGRVGTPGQHSESSGSKEHMKKEFHKKFLAKVLFFSFLIHEVLF
jgi:predicted DNA-binding WGR domain protein